MATIDQLLAGFERFRTRYYNHDGSLLAALSSQGQAPKALVVACCDSRVDPAIILDVDPGELFVIRNVANLVPPEEQGGTYHGTSAAVQFAVQTLNVEHIVILGHSHCGGIQALMGEGAAGRYIGAWMSIAAAAREQVLQAYPEAAQADQAHACELAALRVSLNNLRTFPWIEERVQRGELTLHAWYFDIGAGRLHCEATVIAGEQQGS